ncbi:MAG: hypothetical protein ABW199_07940 [Caulobacterales bacterium]
MKWLKDSVVVVTGAASGIGRGIAEAVSPYGARVALKGMDSSEFIIIGNSAIRSFAQNRLNEVAAALDQIDKRS